MTSTYLVVKDIPVGWETSAKAGDVLTVGVYFGDPTLMLGNKAVCDIDSKCAIENCEPLD